jgi:hypothetical protein
MPPRPSGPQRGLFDNPVGGFSLEELTETVQVLERRRPGRTVDELTSAVFTELGMKRTRRAADLVAEATRIARARGPGPRSPVPAGRPARPRSGNGRPTTASRSVPTAPSRTGHHGIQPDTSRSAILNSICGVIKLVQFHPSYTYEDFFEGFRPSPGGDGSLTFTLRPGRSATSRRWPARTRPRRTS